MNYGEYKENIFELFLLYGLLKSKIALMDDKISKLACKSYDDTCFDRFDFTTMYSKVYIFIPIGRNIHDDIFLFKGFFSAEFYYDDQEDTLLGLLGIYNIKKISVEPLKRADRYIIIEFNTNL